MPRPGAGTRSGRRRSRPASSRWSWSRRPRPLGVRWRTRGGVSHPSRGSVGPEWKYSQCRSCCRPHACDHRREPVRPAPHHPRRSPMPSPGPSTTVVPAHHAVEGAGFEVWRPFPGGLDAARRRPVPPARPARAGRVRSPDEAKGAPWHPHRGFETVTYVLDGEIAHHDSNGGGGVIGEGDTQWMTAGGGILHDEVPSERVRCVTAGARTACSSG